MHHAITDTRDHRYHVIVTGGLNIYGLVIFPVSKNRLIPGFRNCPVIKKNGK